MSVTQFRKWTNVVATVAYLSASGSVVADDTEVFFTQQYRDTSKPNILFVMDTSGSMGNRPANVTDGPIKMDIVKTALKELLDGMTNVNVGLMRFTIPGGPVLQPVLDIDKAGNPLISATILAGTDDAEEASNGSMNLTSSDLDILEEGGQAKWTAVRLRNVDIPRGATVNKAILSLTAYGGSTGTIAVRVFGEASGNAAAFAATNLNISSRTTTTAYSDWTPSTWTDAENYAVDVTSIIQEITSRSDWCGGNALVLMMRRQGVSTGTRVAYSYETLNPVNTEVLPKLNVQFSGTLPTGADGCYVAQAVAVGEAGTDDVAESNAAPYDMSVSATSLRLRSTNDSKAIGLRFPDLRVPQNAEIIDSYLTFRNNTGTNYTGGDTSVRIQGIEEANFVGWTPASGNVVREGLTGTRLPKTTATVDVTLPNWPNNTAVGHTGNLNSVVTEIVSNAGWVSGNALGLIITRLSGAEKRASSYEGRIPVKLTVRYKSRFQTGSYTVRDEMKVATEQLTATGNTPLSDTLLEAGLYYRSEDVVYGATRNSNARNRVSNTSTDTMSVRGTHYVPTGCDPVLDPYDASCKDERLDGTWKYKSPITDVCEDNFIVFLTDGEPTQHDARTNTHYTRMTSGGTCSSANSGSDCFVKLAKHYFEQDQSTALQGVQNVKSYFIGFDINLPLLDNAAAAGGTTGAYLANDASTLATALSDIIDSINIRTNTFVTAGVTVNQTNRLTHLDQLYFAIFAPDITPRWPGNLKRYRLGANGVLKDSLGADAVDPDSDQFLESARSWWSASADGNDPKAGGAASKLTSNRPVYTNLGGTVNITIKQPGNVVNENNTSITAAALTAADADERTKILKWVRGVDVMDEDKDGNFDEANYVFGDPLHSRPALVNYADNTDDGQLRVFVGTNRGELHAINPDTGAEEWAFVPDNLLRNYKVLMNNPEAVTKPYGLDGSIVPFLQDQNRDGKIDRAAGDKAWLYVGMRRGGSNYYAIDVSNPDDPKLMFVITKGVDSDDPYYKLGQTWSHPTIARAKIGSNDVMPVMIFGGGYDVAQDEDGAPVNDTVGNVVYIANAQTGEQLWSSDQISGLGMNKSVPADIAAIDLNGDRLIDHIYAADMGAQIWRFDISSAGVVTGNWLAKFQDTATAVDNRRFYGGVDVGLIQRDDGTSYVAVAAGSGFRERPLDKVIDEHFYVFRDEGIMTNTFTQLTLDDVVDITNLVGDTITTDEFESDAIRAIEQADAYGWYYNFSGVGEKSNTAPVIFDNMVLFTTYVPPSATELENDCGGAAGTGRFYVMQIEDGNPVRDRDGGGLQNTDRYQEITDCPTCGFVPPQLLFTDDDIVGLIGTKPVDVEALRERVKRVKWRNNQQ